MNHLLMISLIVLSSAFAQANSNFAPLIVGGTEAQKGEFPFIVSIQDGYGHFCGGSLISDQWVLTAGHCAHGGSIEKIVIGLHDQNNPGNAEVIKAKKVISHPSFNYNTLEYDFALVQLEKKSSFKPVAINTEEINIPSDPAKAINTITAGWGVLNESSYSIATKLQKVVVPLVPQKACADAYKDFNDVTDTMICAGFDQGGKDACQGDSGGPLVTKSASGEFKLVGVVSWGEGCARPKKYGVYSKVNSVAKWFIFFIFFPPNFDCSKLF